MTLQCGEIEEMKAFNLPLFVFNFFLLNVCACALKKQKQKLKELLNVIHICQEKKSFIFGK